MILPRLHVVCPDDVLARPEFRDVAREVLAAGGRELALHLRPRHAPIRPCLEAAAALVRAARDSGGWLVVNGRVDLALACGAHGVQLGAGALPVAAARRILPAGTAIGVSVHGAAEARRAAADGADFLIAGTIFPTPTHPGGTAGGPGRVRACAAAGLPVIAIGGIGPDRVAPVLAADARGVALVRAVWDADRPAEAVGALRRALEVDGPGSA
ncbi:MAG: thiamine phosphate synthase [Gemmatimonadota bacterium]|nr:thiamine phosphate synthase [Gemmatimonadota bacterium]